MRDILIFRVLLCCHFTNINIVKVAPVHNMMTYRERGTVALFVYRSTPSTSPLWKEPCTHWTGGWMGHKASLDILEKRKSHLLLPESKPWILQL